MPCGQTVVPSRGHKNPEARVSANAQTPMVSNRAAPPKANFRRIRPTLPEDGGWKTSSRVRGDPASGIEVQGYGLTLGSGREQPRDRIAGYIRLKPEAVNQFNTSEPGVMGRRAETLKTLGRGRLYRAVLVGAQVSSLALCEPALRVSAWCLLDHCLLHCDLCGRRRALHELAFGILARRGLNRRRHGGNGQGGSRRNDD